MTARAKPSRPVGEPLRRELEAVLEEALGRRVAVTSAESEPCEFAGRWPSRVLRLELGDGTRLRLFLKEVGLSGHPDKSIPDKEVRMYRDVLTGVGLPVPACYGTRPRPGTGRHALYLEHVDDHSLKYQPLASWYRAAGAVGELHAAFAGRAGELRATGLLPALDAAYFETWADRARSEVAAHVPELTAGIDALLSGHRAVVETLAGAPPTLVHADLGSRNVLVDRSDPDLAVYVVDWENASLGCGVLDLTHLTYGLDPGHRRRLCDAYFRALEGSPLEPATGDEARRLVAAGEVHRAVYRLGRCGRRGYSAEAAAGLLAHAVRYRRELGEGRRGRGPRGPTPGATRTSTPGDR